jgi:hypothetical protein
MPSVPTGEGPDQRSPGPDGAAIRPDGIFLVPAIHRVGPPRGLGRPSHPRVDQRGQRRYHRICGDRVPVIQPLEPPHERGDPALPPGRHSELLHQLRDHVHVVGGHGVLKRFLRAAVGPAPVRGVPPEDRQQAGFQPFQLGQQHVAEQVVVAVPEAAPVQRHQQQVRASEFYQGGVGLGQAEHRFAQRPAHPLEYRGPGEELPVPRRHPCQELRLHVLAHQPVIPAERVFRVSERAALAQVEGRQVQPGGPPFCALVQRRHVVVAQRHVGRAQEQCRLPAAQRQVGRADLQDQALRPQPGDAQRRGVAARQHQP